MKILDPQSALLTNAEVHQFLKANEPRRDSRKQGAHKAANVANYKSVRKDVEHYTALVHPHIITSPPVEAYIRTLVQRLEKYELTKSEVFSLINLGIGFDKAPVTAHGTSLDNGDDEGVTTAEGEETTEDPDADDEDDTAQNSDLSKSLFRLVVEEADDRFPGDEGEETIEEILEVIRECIQVRAEDSADTEMTNGHNHVNGQNESGVSEQSKSQEE